MGVLLGEVTHVSGQCSHVYISVPLRAHVYKVLQVCSSLCISDGRGIHAEHTGGGCSRCALGKNSVHMDVTTT